MGRGLFQFVPGQGRRKQTQPRIFRPVIGQGRPGQRQTGVGIIAVKLVVTAQRRPRKGKRLTSPISVGSIYADQRIALHGLHRLKLLGQYQGKVPDGRSGKGHDLPFTVLTGFGGERRCGALVAVRQGQLQ